MSPQVPPQGELLDFNAIARSNDRMWPICKWTLSRSFRKNLVTPVGTNCGVLCNGVEFRSKSLTFWHTQRLKDSGKSSPQGPNTMAKSWELTSMIGGLLTLSITQPNPLMVRTINPLKHPINTFSSRRTYFHARYGRFHFDLRPQMWYNRRSSTLCVLGWCP